MAPRPPAPERYNAFIHQIDLRSVWIAGARFVNYVGARPLDEPSIDIKTSPAHESATGGSRALQKYTLTITEGVTTVGAIEVTIAAEYTSKIKLSEGLFSVFRDINLPLNTWPYLRVFVAEAFGKMGWAPLTLPAFKTGNSQ